MISSSGFPRQSNLPCRANKAKEVLGLSLKSRSEWWFNGAADVRGGKNELVQGYRSLQVRGAVIIRRNSGMIAGYQSALVRN